MERFNALDTVDNLWNRAQPPAKPRTHYLQVRADTRDALVLAVLVKPHSLDQLAAATGLERTAVRAVVRRLRLDAPQKVHVCGFLPQDSRGRRPKIYLIGSKQDAKERDGDSTSTHERIENAAKAAKLVEAATARQNTWFGALG